MIQLASVQVNSTGNGYVQTIRSGEHTLSADEPVSNGGSDAGFAPYGLLLASLGACTSITLQMYAQRKGWTLGTVQVALRMQKGKEGEGDLIERAVHFGASLTDEQRARLAEICEKTPITKTIKQGTAIATTVTVG
jgi:putative redox protein